MPLALAQLRHLVRRTLQAPAALVEEAAAAAEAAGLVEAGTWTESSPAWESAWSAICQVIPTQTGTGFCKRQLHLLACCASLCESDILNMSVEGL